MTSSSNLLTIDINISNIVSYKQSLMNLVKSSESKLKGLYLTYENNNETLCSWTQGFEKVFKNGAIVKVKGINHMPICEITLRGLKNNKRDGLLYVEKIEQGKECLWTSNPYKENYKVIQGYTEPHDAQGFFYTLHELGTKKVRHFFDSDENTELIWVYFAEAIRHPDRFYSNPGTKHIILERDGNANNTKGWNSLYRISHYREYYFTCWDEHSEKAWLKYISDELNDKVKKIKKSREKTSLPPLPPEKSGLSLTARYFQQNGKRLPWVREYAGLGEIIYNTKFAQGKDTDASQIAQKLHEMLTKAYNIVYNKSK